ncbi:MAG: DUF2442 domain-containing protein [Candidatus Omnitrophica bacterium]|nr:DUF2442 domain-containing protein [Candidatus Omnitrophota bacterium]
MKSNKRGKNTSKAEILNISPNGVWLLVEEREYFLPYEEFPWFEKATVGQVRDVKLLHGHHLYWKALDVDLELDSLKGLSSYPLKYVA